MPAECVHVAKVRDDWPDVSEPVCGECESIDGEWVSLRRCLSCGHIGCCDSSPYKHATEHHKETSHPIVRAIQHDQDLVWCYFDEIAMRHKGDEWVEVDFFLEVGFGYMKEHVSNGGQFNVEEDQMVGKGFPLGQWLVEIRRRDAEGELTNAQRAELMKLKGWRD